MRGIVNRRSGIAAAAVAMLALTGCSGGSGGGPAELSDEPVTIRATWWGGDARHKSTQEAIAAFEDEYPNITVEVQYADWNGYWDQLATATAAGDAPDLIQLDEQYLASYGARGALYDLGQLDIGTGEFEPEALATGQLDGVQYAIPIGLNVYAIIANATLFERYGVELPDDENWTWDDFAALAVELTDRSGGEIHGSTQIGGWDAGSLKYWARQAGNEVFDADGTVTLDPQVLADLWQFQLDLIAEGGIHSPEEIVESFNAGVSAGALATGNVALGAQFNTQVVAIGAASGDDYRLLKLPEPDGIHPSYYKPSMYWSVARTSEHPAEAALLADFLLNSEAAADAIRTDRGIPANSAIRSYLEPNLSGLDRVASEYQDRVTPGAAPVVTPNGASGTEPILQRYTQSVFAGAQSPLAAAEAFIAELQGEIDAAR